MAIMQQATAAWAIVRYLSLAYLNYRPMGIIPGWLVDDRVNAS